MLNRLKELWWIIKPLSKKAEHLLERIAIGEEITVEEAAAQYGPEPFLELIRRGFIQAPIKLVASQEQIDSFRKIGSETTGNED